MARAYVYDESSKQWIPFSGGGKDAVVDPTLSRSGQAADAKVVGEKLGTLNESLAAKADSGLGIKNAKAGQMVQVAAVDETGKPTAFIAAFVTPGGGVSISQSADGLTIE